MTPMKAIRAKCMECCCESFKEVRECHIERCPLWIYRMGHRPKKPAEGGDFEGDDAGEEIIEECDRNRKHPT